MLYAVSFLLVFYQITLGTDLRIFGGASDLFFIFIILSAAYGYWRSWMIWWIGLAITGFYLPLSLWKIACILLASYVGHTLFQKWINRDNLIIAFITVVALLSLSLALLQVRTILTYPWATLGSILLSLPITLGWFFWYSRFGKK